MGMAGSVQVILLALAAIQTVYYEARLPDRVAVHFDAAGNANGWSTPSFLLATYWVVIGLVLLISWIIPATIRKLPRDRINLPNREYWLSEEKYPETIRFLRGHSAWFGVLLLLFLLLVFNDILRANVSGSSHVNSSITLYLIGFLAAVGVWIISLIAKFSRTN